MTPNEPQLNDAGRYSIKETCEALGIHRNSLQIYTKGGFIKCGYRRESMRKYFLGSEIKRFWRSHY